ncbi:MAG: hypothetical protein A4E55_00111 [Pelotomaculum sp. PtaU1.Bin035]|nr:MAG: hypothetical protein A4E55_00111 [Pelotomaculum sp. PtaU1.Bin035]
MNVFEITTFILLGTILGMAGQAARMVVGLKKKYDEASQGKTEDWFNTKQLVISLMIGGVAGTLGAISLLGEELGKQTLLTLIAVGYAGADFIEGFMQKKLPQ